MNSLNNVLQNSLYALVKRIKKMWGEDALNYIFYYIFLPTLTESLELTEHDTLH